MNPPSVPAQGDARLEGDTTAPRARLVVAARAGSTAAFEVLLDGLDGLAALRRDRDDAGGAVIRVATHFSLEVRVDDRELLRQFEALYVSAFMRATKTFVGAAPMWDLEAEAIEVAIRRYLSSSLRLASIDRLESMVQTQDFSKILIAVTKADFGLTAIFLVMDESIRAAKWTVRETFDRTSAAVTECDWS